MRRTSSLMGVALAALLGAVPTLGAQAGPPVTPTDGVRPRTSATADARAVARFALVIGNNLSQQPELKPLRYADDDAVQYGRLLQPLTRELIVLAGLDDATQRRFPEWVARVRPARRAEIDRGLQQLFAAVEQAHAAGERSELLLVFVGHGGADEAGRGYVHLEDGLWRRDELFGQVIAASPAHTTHVVIDACNALSLVAGRGEDALSPDEQERARLERFLSGNDLADYPDVGVLVATSDSRETHEWSRIQAGVFSHLLRSALAGAADINHDGAIEYSEAAAFVDAAGAELDGPGQQLLTFAWPPTRNRRAPLLELDPASLPRLLLVEAPVAGHLFIETASGARWAEFHKAAGQPLLLLLPEGEQCYLRDDEHELELSSTQRIARVDSPPTTPIGTSRRGAAALALEKSLFAVPYSWDFYRGYLAGQPALMPVQHSATPLTLEQAHAQSASRHWTLEAGYLAGMSPLVDGALEHGVQLGARYRLWRGLTALLTLEAGAAPYTQGTLVRAAVWPGVAYHIDLTDNISLSAAAELGYTPTFLVAQQSAGDLSIGAARARAAAHWSIAGGWGPYAALGASAFVVTIGQEEAVRWRPELSVGVQWRAEK